jgi:hypothetical protein
MATIWTFVIMVLCWLPRTLLEDVESETSWLQRPFLDKFVHFAIFVIFAILWGRVWSARRRFTWIALAGFALASVTELVQNLPIVGRDGNLPDTLTDAAGVVIGVAIAPYIEALARFLESRAFPEPTTRPVPVEAAAVAPDTSP